MQLIRHFHSSHQLIVHSHIHQRDVVVFFLSATGMLNYFDLIVTNQDISSKLQSNSSLSLDHKIYHQVVSRLKVDPSVCLFFEDITDEEKYRLLTFNFFDLKMLPESTYRPLSRIALPERRKSLDWKSFGIWIGIPTLFCFLWYLVFLFFKAMTPFLLKSEIIT